MSDSWVKAPPLRSGGVRWVGAMVSLPIVVCRFFDQYIQRPQRIHVEEGDFRALGDPRLRQHQDALLARERKETDPKKPRGDSWVSSRGE